MRPNPFIVHWAVVRHWLRVMSRKMDSARRRAQRARRMRLVKPVFGNMRT